MNNGRQSGYGRHLQIYYNLLDVLVVNLAFLITYLVFPVLPVEAGVPGYRTIWLLVNVSILPALYYQSINRHKRRVILMDHVLRRVVFTIATHALVFLPLSMFLKLWTPSSYKIVGCFYANFLCLLTLARLLSRLLVKYLRRQGRNSVRVAIIGTGETARRLYEHMIVDQGFGYKVRGFFGEKDPGNLKAPYLGKVEDLNEYADKHHIDQIFYTLSGEDESMRYVIKAADNHMIDFYYVPQISRFFSRRFQLHGIGSMPVLSTMRNPLKSWPNRMLKRAFDVVVSGTFLIFYPLIYIPVAIAIKRSSPGPVYFHQKRTGYKGEDFDCLKFRTMKVNSDSDKAQATEHDPRKTRVGEILRKTSIDELPQFINVFKGDMSIIGPRPHMLKHTEDYSRIVDHYMVRHTIKPGITGWAQVNGYRGITDELWKMEKRVEYDVWYIENWSFLLDLKIMVRTVWNALRGEKNAF